MLSMTRHVLALGATSLITSVACDGAGAPPAEGAPLEAPSLAAAPLTLAVPVTVTNGLASPVPTYAVGTANVAVQGTVQAAQAGLWGVSILNPSLTVEARQAGYWQVEVANSDLSVRGVVGATQEGAWTVGAQQEGAWTVGATQVGTWMVALAGTSDVAIVNTPTVELAPGARVGVDELPPVTISGTPAVTLAGTPTVALAGDPEVFVNNTDESPIPVREVGAARSTPWATQKIVSLADGEAGRVEHVLDVPLGKRLVIEHVDAFIQVPTGDGALGATVRSTVGGAPMQFLFPFTSKAELGGVDRLLMAEATTLYADPETAVGVELVRTTTSGTAVGRVTLSGRLVDAE